MRITTNYPSKQSNSSVGWTINDYDTRQSIKIMMNAPKPTNFHNGRSNKYFINDSQSFTYDAKERPKL